MKRIRSWAFWGTALLALGAVAILISLGLWQVDRAFWKATLLADLQKNWSAPGLVLDRPPRADRAFRNARVQCASLSAPQVGGSARDEQGGVGFRHTALCHFRGGGTLLVSLGVGRIPRKDLPALSTHAFSGRLIPRMGDPAFLLVSDQAFFDLSPEAPPNISTIPDNHVSYAIQWFSLALVLMVICIICAFRFFKGAGNK